MSSKISTSLEKADPANRQILRAAITGVVVRNPWIKGSLRLTLASGTALDFQQIGRTFCPHGSCVAESTLDC